MNKAQTSQTPPFSQTPKQTQSVSLRNWGKCNKDYVNSCACPLLCHQPSKCTKYSKEFSAICPFCTRTPPCTNMSCQCSACKETPPTCPPTCNNCNKALNLCPTTTQWCVHHWQLSKARWGHCLEFLHAITKLISRMVSNTSTQSSSISRSKKCKCEGGFYSIFNILFL